MASVASDADWAQLDPDFKAGKKALRAENWNGAIAAFELAALRDPTNADIQNYIGYAYRRLRQMGPAIGHYQKALMLNARHRSAHEHLGEAYLVLGEPAKAQHLLRRWKISACFPARNTTTSSAPLPRTKHWPEIEIDSSAPARQSRVGKGVKRCSRHPSILVVSKVGTLRFAQPMRRDIGGHECDAYCS